MKNTLEFHLDPVLPAYLIKDVLAKLAYLDEAVQTATISGDGATVTLSLSHSPTSEIHAELDARLRHLVSAMATGAFEPTLRIIDEQHFPSKYTKDPIPELIEARQVIPEGLGYFGLGPLLSGVVEYFEYQFLSVANAISAAHYRFPALIAPAYLEKVQYFKNFPHSLTFATHLRGNLPDIERFSAEARTEDGRITVDPGLFAQVPAMLAPTICHHLYFALANSRLSGPGVTVTASGNCFRYESRNMTTLERLWNFTMREIIFVGTEEHVRVSLNNVRERLRKVLTEFEISHKLMTANDPFFIGTFRDQAAYQAAFELKYEIRASLPFKDDSVAIGSYNRHGDFFGRTLDITLEDGSAAYTGCVGIGFERMAYAYVAQHSVDPQNWPRAVREGVAMRQGPGAF